MQTWKQYYAEHTKGKKFKKGEIQAHMRKLASDYRAKKGGDGLSLKGGEVEVEVVGETEPKPAAESKPAEVKKTAKETPMAMPAFHNKKKMVQEEVKDDKSVCCDEKKPMRKRRRIDFSKIHWGAFTDDWMKHGGKRKYKTLEEFSKAVLKKPKTFDPMIVKRARFYKNILLKGKGLSML